MRYSVHTATLRPSCRRSLPPASPSPCRRSSLRRRPSLRRSITTRCPSSAPHFFMYPNVCFTPSSTVHARLLRAESRNTLHSTTNRSHRSDGCPRLARPQHQQVRPASPQAVLPLDATAAVHHPLQVRLQDKLRTGLGVVGEAPPASARNAPRRRCGMPSATSSCSSRRRRPRTTSSARPGCPATRSPAPAAPPLRRSGSRYAEASPARATPGRGCIPSRGRRAGPPRRPGWARRPRRTRASSSLCANWSRCVRRDRINSSRAA